MAGRNGKNNNQLPISRLIIMWTIFGALFFLLIFRLYYIQILNTKKYEDSFTLKTNRKCILKNTRGNIYDCNGNLLAGNQLIYDITMEDNGSYETTREKQLTLNSTVYRLVKLIYTSHMKINNELGITLDNHGKYVFNIDGTALKRFRADVYGKAKIEDMSKEQAEATPDTVMEYLCSDDKFCLYQTYNEDYTEEESEKYQLPDSYTKQEILDLIGIRYMLSLNAFKRYLPVTVAKGVSEEVVAYVLENSNSFQGVNIEQDSIRVYEGGEAFAHILGYTGLISADELDEFRLKNNQYTESSIVGKSGVEQYMESTLQGTDGAEDIYVDNVGKIISKKEKRVDPVPGNDVYLSIEKDLQIAVYKILEQHIAGILVDNISNVTEFNKSAVQDASDIRIPVNEVYYALLNNHIIDVMDFEKTDAGETEKEVYKNFENRQKKIFNRISEELTVQSTAYNMLDEEMQVYEKYIAEELMQKDMGIFNTDAIDAGDKTYLAWKSGTIGLGEYIAYAISQGWIDISGIPSGKTYLDTEEVLRLVNENIRSNLQSDREFCNKIYYFMLKNGELSGYEICRILFEQGVLPEKNEDYQMLLKGEISAYQFIIEKIQKLEITPAQLALDPCSGSAVIVNPKTGHILACVSYPGYDNNRLVNQMDSSYYNGLLDNRSLPLYNRATQQLTAPGSTFKPITAVAGLQEHVITSGTRVFCDGVFDKVETALHCWNRSGHGEVISVSDALKNSCNDYFCEISYRLGLKENNKYSENRALERLQAYAELFDLDKKSGIELTEAKPQVTDQYAIPSSIGQGTHNYTTVQLARYVTTLANKGTSFQLSILGKVTDPDGKIIKEYTPKIQSQVDLPESIWSDLQKGMRQVVENNGNLKDLKIDAAGKTGTAEEVINRPNHGLFIGYAPVSEPNIAIAVRIANGYSSGNAAAVAKDVINYYFGLEEKSAILTGTAVQSAGNQHND